MHHRPRRAVRQPGRHLFHLEVRLFALPADGFGGLQPGIVTVVRLDHVAQPCAAAAEREGHGEHQILARLLDHGRQTDRRTIQEQGRSRC